ncbi:MAG: bifunctional folylpolyglutamate synthase/dihydrofolate synthase [Alphaproteobacteria bacterium]|jgi:dihydrofolate synthase/folylpolyglutamate synthase|tara:strand:+ start:9892 stop:11205 length:1314 start_codon:yes stop_codon:yes gene_type:complete
MSIENINSILQRFILLHPQLIDLSLDRIVSLTKKLGNPEKNIKNIIHVAGTNGKGSTIAYLAASLSAAGEKVDCYTSPHLVEFNERIKIGTNGKQVPISNEDLQDILLECEKMNNKSPITIFEITTVAAFLHFSRTGSDYLLLETGLGGRLDATNIIDKPLITIITPISIDHQDFLGKSIKEIAFEKAGILKKGVPAIIGPQETDAHLVIEERAHELKSSLIKWGTDFIAYEQNGNLIYEDGYGLLDLPMPALEGDHQVINAGTAIAALRNASKRTTDKRYIAEGMLNVEWPARLERLENGSLNKFMLEGSELWLDGGHNTSAAKVISKAMKNLNDRNPMPLIMIVGMMQSKDSKSFLSHFSGICNKVVAINIPDQNNAQDARSIEINACDLGIKASIAQDIKQAIKVDNKNKVRILIVGSLYLAGHVLKVQKETGR